MIEDPAYTVEPWGIRETHLELDNLAQSESVFALSNGHIGVRGNLDEGEPAGLPGTYLNAFWEARPSPVLIPEKRKFTCAEAIFPVSESAKTSI